MIRDRKNITVPIVLALALLAGPLLAGCSVQDIVKNATGGKVDLPGTSLPSDFPKVVPLAKGTILLAAAVGNEKEGKGWNVTVQVESATVDTIAADLQAAGFTVGGIGKTAEGDTAAYNNGTYSVIVLVSKSKGKVIANYVVVTEAAK